jgi:hypothetical protein
LRKITKSGYASDVAPSSWAGDGVLAVANFSAKIDKALLDDILRRYNLELRKKMRPEMRQQLAQLPFEEHEILSGSARVDDIQGHPRGRGSRADERRQKIRKVGELIRLRQKIKTDASEEAALLASLDKAAAELDAGEGVPLERVREKIRGRAGK